ncbi:MAG: hypothetical protein R3C26_22745 [Calditrichia bacterium]
MTAVVKDNELPKGLAALLTEARRIREFGVTPGELDRQKSEMLRGIEQAYRERTNPALRILQQNTCAIFLKTSRFRASPTNTNCGSNTSRKFRWQR